MVMVAATDHIVWLQLWVAAQIIHISCSICGLSGGGSDVSACGACLRKEPRMVLTAINMTKTYIFYSYIRSISDA